MLVKIESRSDYALYIKRTLKTLKLSEPKEKAINNLVMQAFDDGIRLNMKKLEVEVKDG